MSMNLNSDTLRKMADALDEVNKASFEVEQLRVAGHGMKVRKGPDSSGTGTEYKIVGITTGEFSHGSNLR